jgi:hypothetical protein
MTSQPIVVLLRDGTRLFTNAPVKRFTDRLLSSKYDGTQLTVNDQPIALTEVVRIEWPKRVTDE